MLKDWSTELSEKWCRLRIDLVFILNLNFGKIMVFYDIA